MRSVAFHSNLSFYYIHGTGHAQSSMLFCTPGSTQGLLHGSNGGNGGPWNFDQSIIACENHRRRGKKAYPKNSKCSDGQLVAKMAAKLMFRLLSKYLPLNLWSGLVGMTLLGMLLDVLPFFTLPSPRKRAFRPPSQE